LVAVPLQTSDFGSLENVLHTTAAKAAASDIDAETAIGVRFEDVRGSLPHDVELISSARLDRDQLDEDRRVVLRARTIPGHRQQRVVHLWDAADSGRYPVGEHLGSVKASALWWTNGEVESRLIVLGREVKVDESEQRD